jgi:hypothetical protein
MSERLSTDALAALMAAGAVSPAEQLRQTAFRVALVDAWQIPAGARVLEIGFGQGDTTAVLADAVGERGRVVAVDLGEPTYGAPITIGDSARHLGDSLPEAARLDLPPRVRTLLASQGDVLGRIAAREGNRPLPAYTVAATRDP